MSDLHTLELPQRSVKGIGLVVLIHALIIWGLASGLATRFTKKEQAPAVLIDRPDTTVRPEPPPPDLPKPVFNTRPPDTIPAPEVRVDQTAPSISVVIETQPYVREARPATGGGGVEPGQVAVSHPPTVGPLRAEAVCDVMTVPDMPAVNWSGRAELTVQARLVAGRVAEVQFLSVSGGMDPRTRRALQSAVQTALAAYQCRGDQSFTQEFAFLIQ